MNCHTNIKQYVKLSVSIRVGTARLLGFFRLVPIILINILSGISPICVLPQFAYTGHLEFRYKRER